MLNLFKKMGFTSADFPGVSPRTRYGSYVEQPGYVMPWPQVGAGWQQNYYRPLDAGLLRLPRLHVDMPTPFKTTIDRQHTPTIRRQRTGATIYYG